MTTPDMIYPSGNPSGHPSGHPAASRLEALLVDAAGRQASDVHIVPGHPPILRVHGQLVHASEVPLGEDDSRALVEAVLPPKLREQMATCKNFDCSLTVGATDTVRFRANAFMAQGKWCACLRTIPDNIPSLEWMGFPRALAERLVAWNNGLVIITGVTGSGKSTTLAAMIDLLNQRGGTRIITVEEPIEYVHYPRSTSIITQREVGRDVDSFFDGLKYGLRQDPDVILVGEIRDRETARMALSAAETGHLIFATMHTQDAKGAVTRFTDLFPYDVQPDVRTQLALSLRSVVNQHLVPSTDPTGKRALAMEIMHANQPVRTAIRQGKIESLESAIQTGRRDGMVTLDEDLSRLCTTQRITMETARQFAKDPTQLGGYG